nr:reverse transcriptase domain-containing protein [Tanacetum cinerariifolium]
MDNEPVWAADRVVALTLGSAITIPEIANEFAIKAGGIFLYKTPNQAYQLLKDKVLLKFNWAKNQKTKSSLKKTVAFSAEGNSNSDTEKIIARVDAMTIKMDAQYKDLQSRSKQPNLDDDDIPMSREEEVKFMKTFHRTCLYNDYRNHDSNHDNWHSSGRTIITETTVNLTLMINLIFKSNLAILSKLNTRPIILSKTLLWI